MFLGFFSFVYDLIIDVFFDLSSSGVGGIIMGWLLVANDLESIMLNVGVMSGGI